MTGNQTRDIGATHEMRTRFDCQCPTGQSNSDSAATASCQSCPGKVLPVLAAVMQLAKAYATLLTYEQSGTRVAFFKFSVLFHLGITISHSIIINI